MPRGQKRVASQDMANSAPKRAKAINGVASPSSADDTDAAPAAATTKSKAQSKQKPTPKPPVTKKATATNKSAAKEPATKDSTTKSTTKAATSKKAAPKPAPVSKAAPKKRAGSTDAPSKAAAPKEPASKKTAPKKPLAKAAAVKPAPKKPASATVHNLPPSRQLEIFGFGSTGMSELGMGILRTDTIKRPQPVPGLKGVVAVSCGGMHGAALSKDGAVITWGVNDEGALGRNTEPDSDEEEDDDANPNDQVKKEANPAQVEAKYFPSGTKFAQVVAGDSHTHALAEDGTVWGWGTYRSDAGRYGFTLKPGTHDIIVNQTRPMQIPGLKNIVSLAAGADFVLALDNKGKVFAWGVGKQGELGRRLVERRVYEGLLPSPVGFPTRSTKIASIHAGHWTGFAIDTDGATWAWGLNNHGQTGLPYAEQAGKPVPIIGPHKVLSLADKKMRTIASGAFHTFAITQDGECLVFGSATHNKLGLTPDQLPVDDPEKVMLDSNGEPDHLIAPTPLPIPKAVSGTASTATGMVITEDGTAYAAGANDYCQLGLPEKDLLPLTQWTGTNLPGKKVVWAGSGGMWGMVGTPLE